MGIRPLLAVALLAIAIAPSRAQEGKEPVPLDKLTLPPGTVVFITNNPREANPRVNSVLLSPEEFQRLIDAAEKVRRKPAEGPEPPSVCRLALTYDAARDRVRATARYQFKASAPGTAVLLGLQKTQLVSARYDTDRLAVLGTAKESGGFTVTADETGELRLTVEADAAVVARGPQGERGCEVDLPGAAITIVDRIGLPDTARRVRINSKAVPKSLGGNEGVVLGAAKSLSLSWETPAPVVPGEPQYGVDADLHTRFAERTVETTARLTVTVQRGQVGELRVVAPPTAKIRGEAGEGDAPTAVEPPSEARRNVWTLRRTPSTDDWVIEVQLQQSTSRRPLAVTAFGVAGAGAYRGKATVIAPAGYRLNVAPHTDLVRRALPDVDGERREQYAFWSLPASGPLFDFDPQLSRSETELSTAIALQLADDSWKLTGKTDLRPLRQAIDRVEFEVPQEWHDFTVGPDELVESTTVLRETPTARTIQVRLSDPQRRPFALHFGGAIDVAADARQTTLPLPRPTTGFDKVATIEVRAAAGLVVRGTVHEGDRELPLAPSPRGDAVQAACDRVPQRIDLAWQPGRPEITATATVDVTLADNQLSLRHTFALTRPPGQVVLHGPPELAGRVRLTQGGSLQQSAPGQWTVHVAGAGQRASTLTLAYSQILPSLKPDAAVTVPLVWLDGANLIETEVRAWAGQSQQGWLSPTALPGPWSVQPLRAVGEQPRLPALIVQARGTRRPLQLQFSATDDRAPIAVIERALIQAVISADGRQTVRARYAMKPLRGGSVEFVLPPVSEFQCLLDGKKMDVPSAAQRCRVAVEPTSGRPTISVEMTYRYAQPTRGSSVVTPPRPVEPVVVGAVRWQIVAPEHELLLDPGGDCSPMWDWSWRDGLYQPLPELGIAGLNRWYRQAPAPASAEDTDPLQATLLAARPNLEPLRLWRIPGGTFLLGASLAVVGVGLLLLAVRWTPRRTGLGLIVAAGLLVAATRWPQIAVTLLVAAEPGLLVFVVTAVATLVWRRRRSRRAVFARRTRREPPTLMGSASQAHTVTAPAAGVAP